MLSKASPQNDTHNYFSYDENDEAGPQNWGKINSNCNGRGQSPINLEEKLAKPGFNKPLVIDGLRLKPSSVKFKNNGHSASIRLEFPKQKQIVLKGGPLIGNYILDNIHWHWGDTDCAGSEHTLNGRRFAAEVHLVTYRSKYSEFNGLVFLINKN